MVKRMVSHENVEFPWSKSLKYLPNIGLDFAEKWATEEAKVPRKIMVCNIYQDFVWILLKNEQTRKLKFHERLWFVISTKTWPRFR